MEGEGDFESERSQLLFKGVTSSSVDLLPGECWMTVSPVAKVSCTGLIAAVPVNLCELPKEL